MYKKILIAIDGSELSKGALETGLKLAKPLGASVTVATVTDRWPLIEAAVQAQSGIDNPEKYYQELAKREADTAFELADQSAQELGVPCENVHIMDRHPAEGILQAASDTKSDLIVIASHGRRGLTRMLLGSVANEVTASSEVPVLVVK